MFDSIVSEARDLGLERAEDDRVLEFFEQRGLSFVQSAIAYAKLRGVSLVRAKEILSEHQTEEASARQANFHDSLARAVDDEAERDSAQDAPPHGPIN